MSEMVDRVAKAIFEAWAKDAGLPEDDRNWSDVVRVNHSIVPLARLEARAAIAAMRDPTFEMRVADAVKEWPDDAAACWRAMIDAALGAPAIVPHHGEKP